jgi:myosin heavy subunit
MFFYKFTFISFFLRIFFIGFIHSGLSMTSEPFNIWKNSNPYPIATFLPSEKDIEDTTTSDGKILFRDINNWPYELGEGAPSYIDQWISVNQSDNSITIDWKKFSNDCSYLQYNIKNDCLMRWLIVSLNEIDPVKKVQYFITVNALLHVTFYEELSSSSKEESTTEEDETSCYNEDTEESTEISTVEKPIIKIKKETVTSIINQKVASIKNAEELKEKLIEKDKELTEKKETIKLQLKELKDLNKMIEQLQKKINKKTSKETENKKTIDKLSNKNTNLEEDFKNLSLTKNTMEMTLLAQALELEEQKRQILQLEGQKENLENKYKFLELQNEQLQNKPPAEKNKVTLNSQIRAYSPYLLGLVIALCLIRDHKWFLSFVY